LSAETKDESPERQENSQKAWRKGV
jgi:hypothetical protein